MNQLQWIALTTLVRKEYNRIVRIWTQTLLPPLITQSLYFLIFGKFIGSQVGDVHGISYMEFVVPGLIMMAVVNNSYGNVVSSFFGSKFQRNIEEMLVSPMKPWVMVAGFMTGGMIRGIWVGVMVFIISCVFTKPHLAHPFIMMFFIILTSACFSLAGMINGIFAKNFDEVAFFQNFILVPLIYLGGVFYAISHLPLIWQKVSLVNPLVYMVNGLRYGFYGVSDVSVNISIVILLLLVVFLWIINVHLISKGIGIKN